MNLLTFSGIVDWTAAVQLVVIRDEGAGSWSLICSAGLCTGSCAVQGWQTSRHKGGSRDPIINFPGALISVPTCITTGVLREELYDDDSTHPAWETGRSSKLSYWSATPPQLVGPVCYSTLQSHFSPHLYATCVVSLCRGWFWVWESHSEQSDFSSWQRVIAQVNRIIPQAFSSAESQQPHFLHLHWYLQPFLSSSILCFFLEDIISFWCCCMRNLPLFTLC